MKQLAKTVRSHQPLIWSLLALVLPAGLCACFIPFRESFTNVGAALVLVALIEGIAVVSNRLSAYVATVSAFVWFDFFLTPPFDRLTISHRPDLETTISIAVVGVIVSEVAARSRRHRRIAREESGFVALLAQTASLCSPRTEPNAAIDFVTRCLLDILHLRDCRFEATLEGPPPARIEFNGNVIHVGLQWPANEIGIPGPQSEIPAIYQGRTVGHFLLTPSPGVPVSRERRIVASTMVSLVAPLISSRSSSTPSQLEDSR